jgi:transcriptional regulator with XRE-family HTH domain
MGIRFDEIGDRLRAYRLGMNYSASEIAQKIGVSRAAVYRLEKGELVKIETLEKLSELLDVSLPSLLGVGVEYYSNAVAFFERMRQLEKDAVHVTGNFSPFSFLLVSDGYMAYLRQMLVEAIPDSSPDRTGAIDYIEKVVAILAERRVAAVRKSTPIATVVGAQDIERFLRFGLIGRFDLPPDVHAERRRAARAEVERLIDVLTRQPLGVQVGVVEDMPPSQTFQVFETRTGSAVTLSPYRLGDQPNISSGIAMITSAPEAVRLFKDKIARQWDRAHKGESGARILRQMLDRNHLDEVLPAKAQIS